MAGENIAEEMEQLGRENQDLKAESERLRRMLEEALRASPRQAVPFLATPPQSPTLETGAEKRPEVWSTLSSAGPEASRRSSGSTEVPLPSRCPRCGGGLEEEETVSQQAIFGRLGTDAKGRIRKDGLQAATRPP